MGLKMKKRGTVENNGANRLIYINVIFFSHCVLLLVKAKAMLI